MQADAVPHAVRELIDDWRSDGVAAQPPITWPRQRWVEGLPEHKATLGALPPELDREAVRQACQDAAADTASAAAAFVAVMAWGFGAVGYGPHRARRMLATPDAPRRLHEAIRTLTDDGPVAAYRRLARGDDCRLVRLGPAFATKYLYFCQPRQVPMTGLILDDLVADCRVTFRLDPVPWSAPTYQRYLEQMHTWAHELGCAPDDLERCMFQAEATRRGGQWAVTRSDQPR